MTNRKQVDPGRALLGLLKENAKHAVRQHAVQLDTGEILDPNDPDDGCVVELDNMQVPATDCIVCDHVTAVNGLLPGDRVLVLYQNEDFYIIGVI